MENLSKKIELLKYKNQIILQGPPGTGKTKLAKEIALKMIGTNDDVNLNTYLKKGLSIPNASGADDYYLIEKVTDNSVELSSERATKKWSASFNKIREKLSQLQRGENPKNKGGDDPYVLAVAKHIFKNIKNSSDALKNNNQFKLIQFHPSYTYEDFVRGIVAKPNPDGDGIVYEAENKTLGIFAKTALENYNKSQVITTHNLIDNDFERFKNYVIEQIDLYGKFEISEKIYIYLVEDARFKYKGDTWTAHPNGLNMNFSQLIKIIEQNLNSRQEINKSELLNSLTRQHATYYQNFLELYRKYIDDNPIVLKEEKLKNYVLIIDEINRANLSSVLGELIYALEYRGEEVESMYEVDGSQKLILPPNLYIIGTMNTADRSVGHIDYAIRRRFAFVDVLPKNLIMELGSDFKKDIFTKVSELFIENYNPEIDYGPEESRLNRSQHLSEEFEPKDVWLGHSYFIQHYERDATGNNDIEQPIDFTLRLDYEIKPILREYVKDGILKPGALEIIENLGK
ncbi:MAG: ATPase [Chryseobacterium sp.]|nr:ATPase [Chryseobacterium sp.]